MLVTKHLTVAIDYHVKKMFLWKSMAAVNCLFPNKLKISAFMFKRKKLIHTGLEQLEDE